MEFTREDSGTSCTARVGDELTVILAENPTTGYRWHCEIDPAVLEPAGDRYEGPIEPRGASGTRRLTFRIARAGTTRLRLVKRREWEDTAVEEFHIDVAVENH